VQVRRVAHRPGAAEAELVAGQALQLDRHVLDDMRHVRAVAQPLDEAARPPRRAAVLDQRRDRRQQAIGEA
jgi:hypothetical protein